MSLRVLYTAYRNDPRDIDAASSMEYGFYDSLQRAGVQVKVIGPFVKQVNPMFTRFVRKGFRIATGKGYTLFPPLVMYKISKLIAKAEEAFQPDVIFAVMPSPLAFYSGSTPIVWRSDITYERFYRSYYGYSVPWRGRLAKEIDKYMQVRSIRKAARIVTASDFCKYSLMFDYSVPAERIDVLTNPSAIPISCVPESIDVRRDKRLDEPLRLLFVGRQGYQKGLDIAIEIVTLLNARGVPAKLVACTKQSQGLHQNVEYVGTFKKSDPDQLREYTNLYRNAHLLVHPARFEPAGIVPSEAAAFATPTITNDVGGLSTTVADGVSGVVLRAGSCAEAYVGAISDLVCDPERYYALCETTRRRYEHELNWYVVSERFVKILEEVANGE